MAESRTMNRSVDGDALRRLLRDREMQHQQFAARVGVTAHWISAIINRGKSVSPKLLRRMCEVLDVDENDLTGGNGADSNRNAQEGELLAAFRQLAEVDKARILVYLTDLASTQPTPKIARLIGRAQAELERHLRPPPGS